MVNLRAMLEKELAADIISMLQGKGAVVDDVSTHTILISEQEIKRNPLLLLWRSCSTELRYIFLAEPVTQEGGLIVETSRRIFSDYASWSKTQSFMPGSPSYEIIRKVKKRAGVDLSGYIS